MQNVTSSKNDPQFTGSNQYAFSFSFYNYESKINKALDEIVQDKIIERILSNDYSVWKPSPEEISNRLGWLNIAEEMQSNISSLNSFTEDIKASGFKKAILLGMGGSSLAPEVLHKTFEVKEGYIDLKILDSTDPDAIATLTETLDLQHTIFIVATKSGGTVETLSFFKYFYNQVQDLVGTKKTGSHFIAITDPGSKLVRMAEEYKFRRVFLNDPNIGGRYSALSYFGLVPAALIGIDLRQFLDRAQKTTDEYKDIHAANIQHSLGIILGVSMGEMAKAGRDKLTLVLSPQIQSFSNWVEQLVAESTGKEGTGILPVIENDLEPVFINGQDRFVVLLTLKSDHRFDNDLEKVKDLQIPFIQIKVNDPLDLSGQFFTWEMATALAGYRLGINPFDQPNVESAKTVAKRLVAEYIQNGKLPAYNAINIAKGIQALSDISTDSLPLLLSRFLSLANTNAYISIQAYLQETTESNKILTALKEKIHKNTHLAVTIGYGPRFLHSTGQYHKGDSGHGLSIQLISSTQKDLSIPDTAGSNETSISFGVLKLAQALGDRQALIDENRKVISFIIEGDSTQAIKQIIQALDDQ